MRKHAPAPPVSRAGMHAGLNVVKLRKEDGVRCESTACLEARTRVMYWVPFLVQVIVKSGDDCRQEHLALQLVSHFRGMCRGALSHGGSVLLQDWLSRSPRLSWVPRRMFTASLLVGSRFLPPGFPWPCRHLPRGRAAPVAAAVRDPGHVVEDGPHRDRHGQRKHGNTLSWLAWLRSPHQQTQEKTPSLCVRQRKLEDRGP